MINWAEKQAPEDRQATEDVLDVLTQYGVEGAKRSLSSLEDRARATGQLTSYCKQTMLREIVTGRSQGAPQRLKAS